MTATRINQTAYGMLIGMSNTVNLTTTSQKAPMNTFIGFGCSKSSNGIKVSEAGVYLISAQMYYSTGFTAGDIIHTEINKNGNTVLSETVARATNANPYTTYQTGPVITELAAGDTVYVYVRNQTAARGNAYSDDRGNTLALVRIA